MRRYTRDELQAFLKSVDTHAPKGVRVVIIGGAAATLSFGASGGTIDIDTANSVLALRKACDAARKETGLSIPLGHASVFGAPKGYERRLIPLALRGMRRLHVLVPEKHDWALMKVVRFEDKDLEHLRDASQGVGFDLKILEERLLTEMAHLEPRARLVIHFLAMVEELYGEPDAARLQKILQAPKSWR